MWRSKIRKMLPGIDLKYDMLISLHVTGLEKFEQYAEVLPYYKNVLAEGVRLVG